jgi:ABC-type molybdate transport system substrate-binding protein
MVVAYLSTDPKTQGIAAAGQFMPPASIPNAAPEWYQVLLGPGVRIGSSHPFLDPGGYRAHMIVRLAEAYYNVPNLSNLLLEHVAINGTAGSGGGGTDTPTLGRDYNFQFIYEHSAAAAAKKDPSYRYVVLPDRIDLSTSRNDSFYSRASITIPALGPAAVMASVSIPATRVAWGLTVLKKSQNPQNALAFVRLLLGPAGVAAFTAHGPVPITPALVSDSDYARLPKSLRPLVAAGPVLP